MIGEQVVCIKTFINRMGQTFGGSVPVWDVPQVGVAYTVEDVHTHPWEGKVGYTLVEIDERAPSGRKWVWDARHFRRVTKIEEPKRVVTEIDRPKELEPA